MKILVVTSVFPNSSQPTLGVFVRERMFQVAKHCEIKVIAPVPWFRFAGFLNKGYSPNIPYLEMQNGIEVYHPKFFYIPRFFKFLDGFFFFLSSIFTVWKVGRDFKFDMIDSHFAYPDGFGSVLIGKLFRKPVTLTVRGTIRKLSKYRLLNLQIKVALERATKVFAVCADLKKAIVDMGIPAEKVVVIPNGVDIEKFRPIERLKARNKLGIPADKKVIISVGGLVERKGFHRVISVLPEIKKSIPEIMYIIVGGASVEGNYEPVLRQMVKELGLGEVVLFAGPQQHDKLYNWLSASDIFCLATSNEGWANVFLEAMACGLPVVTTRVGGNEEVVSSEEYGLLFDLGNEKEMVDKIIKSFRNKWNKKKIMDYAKSNTWAERTNSLFVEFGKIVSLHRLTITKRELKIFKYIFLALAFFTIFSTCSCRSLVIKDEDSTKDKAGKVLGRVLLGVGTLGLSEETIKGYEKEEMREKQAGIILRNHSVLTLQAIEDIGKAEKEIAFMVRQQREEEIQYHLIIAGNFLESAIEKLKGFNKIKGEESVAERFKEAITDIVNKKKQFIGYLIKNERGAAAASGDLANQRIIEVLDGILQLTTSNRHIFSKEEVDKITIQKEAWSQLLKSGPVFQPPHPPKNVF